MLGEIRQTPYDFTYMWNAMSFKEAGHCVGPPARLIRLSAYWGRFLRGAFLEFLSHFQLNAASPHVHY